MCYQVSLVLPCLPHPNPYLQEAMVSMASDGSKDRQ